MLIAEYYFPTRTVLEPFVGVLGGAYWEDGEASPAVGGELGSKIYLSDDEDFGLVLEYELAYDLDAEDVEHNFNIGLFYLYE